MTPLQARVASIIGEDAARRLMAAGIGFRAKDSGPVAPKMGRPAIPDATRARIEDLLARPGRLSSKAIARIVGGVSPDTVRRVDRALRARRAASTAPRPTAQEGAAP